MSNDIKSMFESIKESLAVQNQDAVSFRNYLKMEVGKTYLVRVVPNIEDPKATFFHYKHHGFTSLSTGQYVDATCPREFGDRCSVCEERFKLYKTKTEDDRQLAYNIRPHEKHLVNVYVVSDPTNPDNEGSVKILRFGKRIYDKILAATEGDDADEFGHRVYDLTENGCNFKIKVESTSEGNRKFTNYNNSRFTAPSAIPNMTPEKIKEVYTELFDLSEVLEMKSEGELKGIISQHILCNEGEDTTEDDKEDKDANDSIAEAIEKVEEAETEAETESETEAEPEAEPEKKKTTKKAPKKDTAKKSGNDAKIQNLLDGLDNL